MNPQLWAELLAAVEAYRGEASKESQDENAERVWTSVYQVLRDRCALVPFWVPGIANDSRVLDEIAQDATVRLFESSDTLLTVRNPSAYIAKVIRNAAFSWARRGAGTSEPLTEDLVARSEIPSEDYVQQTIAQISDQLNGQERAIFALLASGLSAGDIASRLGIKRSTVYVVVFRLRRKLGR